MKRIIIKILPYLSVIVIAIILFLIGIHSNENVKNVLLGISGTFISIPLLFLFYEAITNYSNKKVNKEIFDYVKVQVDTILLSIISQLIKMIYDIENQTKTLNDFKKFLNLEKVDLRNAIIKENKIGFQVLKEFDINEDNLHKLLSHAFIIGKLENNQIIAIIKLIKCIRELIWAQNNGLFECIDQKVNGFKIVKGTEFNEKNTEFPDRYLLMRELTSNKSSVEDFGDFAEYKEGKLLHYHKVREDCIDYFTEAVYDLIRTINSWLALTGNEFLIDNKVFRLRPEKARA